MNHPPFRRRLAVGLVSVSLVLVACSAAAAPSASTPPVASPPDTTVTSPPSDGSAGSTDPGGIGGGDKLVVPKPGQLEVHDVPADEFVARVEGSTIIVTASWTSGVEPCNVLDQIVITPGANTFAITLREGHGPEDIACIMIAEIHKTEFQIPNVAPGTYQITDATGHAPALQVTVD